MKFSCCIEMLFPEVSFVERIYRAGEAGFDCVEFWCWEDKDLPAIRKALDETGLEAALMQGNLRGRMVDPADRALYVEGARRSVEAAKALGVRRLFFMSDVLRADRSVEPAPYPLSEETKRAATLAVLRELAPLAEAADMTFLIEPLNTKVDHRGYSLCHSDDGADLIRQVGSPHVRLLYDAYHMQIMEGDLIGHIRANHDTFGYFHVADVPGRCQPGTGEICYENVLRALKATGYDGYVGFEFSSRGAPSAQVTRTLLETFRKL